MPSHIYIHPLEVVTSSLLPSLVWEPQWLPIVLEIKPKLLMLAFNTLCNLVPLTTSIILIVLFIPDILMFLFLKHTKFFLYQDASTFLFFTWIFFPRSSFDWLLIIQASAQMSLSWRDLLRLSQLTLFITLTLICFIFFIALVCLSHLNVNSLRVNSLLLFVS